MVGIHIHVSNPGFNCYGALDGYCTLEGVERRGPKTSAACTYVTHDEGPGSFVKRHVSQENENENENEKEGLGSGARACQ